MFSLVVFLAAASLCSASLGDGPVDCAFSVWSEWSPQGGGQYEVRTRDIYRRASGDGRPCTGRTIEYRSDEPNYVPAEDTFLSRFLPGDRPSYSLGGGNSNSRYTLSRDILLMLDTIVSASLFPYYKALVSNLVGKICGEIGGSSPSDNRIAMGTYHRDTAPIHTFHDNIGRSIIQDQILRVPRFPDSSQQSNLFSAIEFARTFIVEERFGARAYSNSTKEVLLVTSYKDDCARAVYRAARRLGTVSVVYVIVVGDGATPSSPPSNWCLRDHVASDPPRFHFLHLDSIQRISHVSRILLEQSLNNNKFCQNNSGQQ